MHHDQLNRSTGFNTAQAAEIRLRSSLSSILDVINVTPFDHNVHHRGF
jgi:hypothetical protein